MTEGNQQDPQIAINETYPDSTDSQPGSRNSLPETLRPSQVTPPKSISALNGTEMNSELKFWLKAKVS